MEPEKSMITEAEILANKEATFVRRMAGRFANTKWPKLLVLKDKHESEYFLINDIDALWRASLVILENRVQSHYIRAPQPVRTVEEVPDEWIAKLPETLRKKALQDKTENKRSLREHQREVDDWEGTQKALTERNGALAFKVLNDRRDYEYEGFFFENLKIP